MPIKFYCYCVECTFNNKGDCRKTSVSIDREGRCDSKHIPDSMG
jgi:hypothetical protein